MTPSDGDFRFQAPIFPPFGPGARRQQLGGPAGADQPPSSFAPPAAPASTEPEPAAQQAPADEPAPWEVSDLLAEPDASPAAEPEAADELAMPWEAPAGPEPEPTAEDAGGAEDLPWLEMPEGARQPTAEEPAAAVEGEGDGAGLPEWMEWAPEAAQAGAPPADIELQPWDLSPDAREPVAGEDLVAEFGSGALEPADADDDASPLDGLELEPWGGTLSGSSGADASAGAGAVEDEGALDGLELEPWGSDFSGAAAAAGGTAEAGAADAGAGEDAGPLDGLELQPWDASPEVREPERALEAEVEAAATPEYLDLPPAWEAPGEGHHAAAAHAVEPPVFEIGDVAALTEEPAALAREDAEEEEPWETPAEPAPAQEAGVAPQPAAPQPAAAFPAAVSPDVLAASLAGVADRLEAIARNLRERPAELLAGGEAADPLGLLIVGFALGATQSSRVGNG